MVSPAGGALQRAGAVSDVGEGEDGRAGAQPRPSCCPAALPALTPETTVLTLNCTEEEGQLMEVRGLEHSGEDAPVGLTRGFPEPNTPSPSFLLQHLVLPCPHPPWPLTQLL